jgi:hypothetical protein
MKDEKLADGDHIMRYVPSSKLRRRDGTTEVIGILPQAFSMREIDEYLSATWLEFFPGDKKQRTLSAVHAMRASSLDVKPNSGFTIGNVASVRAACSQRRHNIRIVHEPEDDNNAHVAVRRFPKDDIELFEALAIDSWSDWFLNSTIP